MKLNILLAKTDHLGSSYKAMTKDYLTFFNKKQGAFLGQRKTYIAAEGMLDEPSKRSLVKVQTTVKEKLDWYRENAADYIDCLFAQEATNASGTAKAELIVGDESWGEFTSLELLRLKSVLEDMNFYNMLTAIPVRSDSEQWEPTADEMYKGRNILESPLQEGVVKTTVKESYIIEDPNINKIDGAKYTPQLGQKNTVVEVGNYTTQFFSGEVSQRERADILKRRTVLLTAVIEALKKCNEAESVKSELTADKLYGYLFG